MPNKNIQHLTNQISQHFQPEKIILFGSHAYGNPDEDSDVDILVIMDYNGTARKKAAPILQSVDYHFVLDIIVRSSEQVSKRISQGDFFLGDIIEKGIVLYDRNSF